MTKVPFDPNRTFVFHCQLSGFLAHALVVGDYMDSLHLLLGCSSVEDIMTFKSGRDAAEFGQNA